MTTIIVITFNSVSKLLTKASCFTHFNRGGILNSMILIRVADAGYTMSVLLDCAMGMGALKALECVHLGTMQTIVKDNGFRPSRRPKAGYLSNRSASRKPRTIVPITITIITKQQSV